MDPPEDQCSTSVLACFDDADAGFKYSIDGLRYFEQRMFVPDEWMTDFGDLDRVLADEILQPSGMTHPGREFRLE